MEHGFLTIRFSRRGRSDGCFGVAASVILHRPPSQKEELPARTVRALVITALATVLTAAAVASAATGIPRPAAVATPLPTAAAEAKAGIVDLSAAPGGGSYAALAGFGRPAFFGLVRLDGAGAPDPGFGDGGFTAPFADPLDSSVAPGPTISGPEAEAVAVQPDGKILVAGAVASRAYIAEDGYTLEYFRPLLVRYLPDGSLDPSFGTGGWIEPGEGGGGVIHDVVVTADGQIIAAVGSDVRRHGSAGAPGIYAFTSDGSVDPGFGREGRALVRRSGSPVADPRSLVLLPDGDVLLSAYRDSRPVLSRLLPDGRLDRSFGGDGFVRPAAPQARCCVRLPLAVGPEGRPTFALVVGDRRQRVLLARFRPNGGADRSFGGDGLVASPARFEDAHGIAVADDGSLYVAGDARHRDRGRISFAYAVVHIAADGGPDPSFGRRGIEVLVRGIASIAGAALAQPDGVLVGGSYQLPAAIGTTHPTALLLTGYPAD
jgi:uncharacterized delta-60 repeat protein